MFGGRPQARIGPWPDPTESQEPTGCDFPTLTPTPARVAIASTLATAGRRRGPAAASPAGTLDGHAEAVYSVAWTPDGKSIVSGGFDQTVRLWDVASRKEIKRLEGHTGLVLTVAVDKDGRQILSGGLDKTAKVWEIPASGPSKTLADNPAAVRAVALRPDGKQLAAASGKVVKVWDLDARSRSATSPGTPRTSSRSPGGPTVRRSPRATRPRRSASGSRQRRAPRDDRDPLRHRPRPGLPARQPADSSPPAPTASPGSGRCPRGRGQGRGPVRTFTGHKGRSSAVGRRPGRQEVGHGLGRQDGQGLRGRDRQGTPDARGHADAVRAVAVTRDGQKVVTGSADKTVKVWNLADGKLLLTYPALPASVDLGRRGPTARRSWSAWPTARPSSSTSPRPTRPRPSGRPSPATPGRSRPSRSCPTTRPCSPASEDRTIKLWPASRRAARRPSPATAARSTPWPGRPTQGPTGSADASVRIWDVGQGRPRSRRSRRPTPASVYAVAWSPKGDVLVDRRRRQGRQVLGPGRGQGASQGGGARRGGLLPGLPPRRLQARLGLGRQDDPALERRRWQGGQASSTATPTTSTASPSAPTASGWPRSATAGNLCSGTSKPARPCPARRSRRASMTYGVAWSPDGKTARRRGLGQQDRAVQRPLMVLRIQVERLIGLGQAGMPAPPIGGRHAWPPDVIRMIESNARLTIA